MSKSSLKPQTDPRNISKMFSLFPSRVDPQQVHVHLIPQMWDRKTFAYQFSYIVADNTQCICLIYCQFDHTIDAQWDHEQIAHT